MVGRKIRRADGVANGYDFNAPVLSRWYRVAMAIRLSNGSEPEDVDLQPLEKYDRLGVLHAFAAAIRGGTPPSFFPSGHDNISTLSIVQAAIASSLQGGASVKIGTVH